jgi:hypothetical protein
MSDYNRSSSYPILDWIAEHWLLTVVLTVVVFDGTAEIIRALVGCRP